MKSKECVLTDKPCTDCGECDICDLNPKKVCDNCCKCIDSKTDFRGVYIDEIIDDEDKPEIEELEDEDWKFNEEVVEEIGK